MMTTTKSIRQKNTCQHVYVFPPWIMRCTFGFVLRYSKRLKIIKQSNMLRCFDVANQITK